MELQLPGVTQAEISSGSLSHISQFHITILQILILLLTAYHVFVILLLFQDEDSPFIQPEPVIASVKPVTQISIPASQVLQPHVLKSLQALQSPSKQGGDGVSTQQQVIKLVRVSLHIIPILPILM